MVSSVSVSVLFYMCVVPGQESRTASNHQHRVVHAGFSVQRAATSSHAERIYCEQLHTNCAGSQDQRDCTTLQETKERSAAVCSCIVASKLYLPPKSRKPADLNSEFSVLFARDTKCRLLSQLRLPLLLYLTECRKLLSLCYSIDSI